jgi:sec-independent protein translocase protein TatC
MPNEIETVVEKARTNISTRAELPGMSLLEHLEELRRRIIWSALSVAACFGIAWNYSKVIAGYMQQPIVAALHHYNYDPQLVFTNPTEPFNIYLKIGLWGGVVLASPFILYQVWLFISPGLYRHEKKYIIPFMLATVGLFLSGCLFGFKIVYPAALDFLINQGQQFKPMITVGEYADLFVVLIVGLGIVFELPILILFLSLMGIVSAGWLWRNLRYSILIIFLIAAIVTPTTDILNMCIFAAPMVVLYLLSIGVAWFVHPTRRKARAQIR